MFLNLQDHHQKHSKSQLREGGIIWQKKTLERRRKFLERTGQLKSDGSTSESDHETDSVLKKSKQEEEECFIDESDLMKIRFE